NSLWDSLVKTEAKFGATPKSTFSPGDLNHQTERTLATYVAADYEGVIGGLKVDGNAGVRLVRTSTGSSGT
ncbi:hypothetical protein LXJ58_33760, partial [Escherichia coli]|nr:hypothetical protein [Escherichia coli]